MKAKIISLVQFIEVVVFIASGATLLGCLFDMIWMHSLLVYKIALTSYAIAMSTVLVVTLTPED